MKGHGGAAGSCPGRPHLDLEGPRPVQQAGRTPVPDPRGRLLPGLRKRPRRWPQHPSAPAAALALLFLTVAVLHVLSYPGRFNVAPPMLSPQENVRFELALRWVEEGRPGWALRIPPGLPVDAVPALTPRDAALQRDTVVPKDFPFAIGLTALLGRVDLRLALAISLLSGIALLAAVASLARRLGGPWSGVTAAAVVATTGSFMAGTGGPLNTGAAVAAAVLIGVLLLVPRPEELTSSERCGNTAVGLPHRAPAVRPASHVGGIRRTGHQRRLPRGFASSCCETSRRDVLAGISWGVAANLHHDVVLLTAGLLVPFILPSQGGLSRALRVGGGILIALLPGLAYYAWVNGSPFETGYAVAARTLGGHLFAVMPLDLGMLLRHLQRYVARPEVCALLACAFLTSWYARSSSTLRLAWGLLLGAVPYLVFVGSRPLYGIDRFTLGASFLRYALPVVALLVCLCTARPGREPLPSRGFRATVVGVSALVGVALLIQDPGGLVDQRRQVLHSAQLRADILGVTEPDAIVVTARGDKLLWPRRTTLTAAYLIRDPTEGIRYGPTTYDVVPTPRRLAQVVANLARAGDKVYVLSDSLPPYVAGLDVELGLVGARREPTPVRSLFLIAPA
jgi:hypothetical protein